MNITELVYTSIAKYTWLRKLVDKIIISILPASVQVDNAVIVINPNDPVISGALTFGVYESNEIALMKKLCKLGQVVLDIGANVGLYTAIAGSKVGSSGLVIALEPEPENFHYLQKTVHANALQNTRILCAAASFENGKAHLFTSSKNRGDHRMYASETADGKIEIDTLKLDDYLQQQGIHAADIIKIDVQGFEGHVITGLEKTLRRSAKLIMLMEFWPQGLRSAGTDPLELLTRLENLGLTIYQVKKYNQFARVTNKNQLIDRMFGRKYANLIFVGAEAEWLSHDTIEERIS